MAVVSGVATMRTALATVLSAPDLQSAHAAARAGLDRLDAGMRVEGSDIIEVPDAARLAGVTESAVRKWAARYGRTPQRFGHRLGGRWLLSRAKFLAFIAGERS